MFVLTRKPPLVPAEFRRTFRVTLEDALGEDLEALRTLRLLRCGPDGYRFTVKDPIGVFAASMFLAGDDAVRDAMDWIAPAGASSREGVRLGGADPAEAERQRVLRKTRVAVEALLPLSVLEPVLPAGWRASFLVLEPHVVIEISRGCAGLPLRVGIAPRGTSPSCFAHTDDLDISYLTDGGCDVMADAAAKEVFERVLELARASFCFPAVVLDSSCRGGGG